MKKKLNLSMGHIPNDPQDIYEQDEPTKYVMLHGQSGYQVRMLYPEKYLTKLKERYDAFFPTKERAAKGLKDILRADFYNAINQSFETWANQNNIYEMIEKKLSEGGNLKLTGPVINFTVEK